MLKAYIKKKVDQYLSELWTIRKSELPSGFYPLEQFYNGARRVVTLPWGSEYRTLIIRTLGAGEAPDINTIIKISNKKDKTESDLDTIINIGEDCAKKSFVNPTYEEIKKALTDADPVLKEGMKSFTRIENEIKDLAAKNGVTFPVAGRSLGNKRWEEFCSISRIYGCLLPINTINALLWWQVGSGVTDAESVTEDKLLEAYYLSQRFHGRPSDYIHGCFVEQTRLEIDIKAAELYVRHSKRETGNRGGRDRSRGRDKNIR
ncbi:MAG: hypothetical protein LBJ41_01865 [Treponema sp.]|jgi:hypothetical protein|nr:hypothetical protein [Treponema sp.]